jgi:hypothetical protein
MSEDAIDWISMEISKTGGHAREGELERKGKEMERGRKIFIITLSKLSLDDSMFFCCTYGRCKEMFQF